MAHFPFVASFWIAFGKFPNVLLFENTSSILLLSKTDFNSFVTSGTYAPLCLFLSFDSQDIFPHKIVNKIIIWTINTCIIIDNVAELFVLYCLDRTLAMTMMISITFANMQKMSEDFLYRQSEANGKRFVKNFINPYRGQCPQSWTLTSTRQKPTFHPLKCYCGMILYEIAENWWCTIKLIQRGCILNVGNLGSDGKWRS